MTTYPVTRHASCVTPHVAVRRILVRGPNWIGDAVMCEPALRAVRNLFPEATISLLVKPAIAELLKGHPAVNQVLVYDDRGRHAGLSGKWTLAGVLRRHRFDLAILFQNAFEAALLSFLAGIPRRYGYATDGRGFLLSDPITPTPRAKVKHQVEYYWDLLRPLGCWGQPDAPRVFLSREEESAMAERLAAGGILPSDFLIGVNPGSTYGGAKRWLPERFAETVNRLIEEQGPGIGRPMKAAIVGAKGEEALGRTIAGLIRATTVVLSGRTTVRELMAVTKRCGLFLTNDTGPMHIAAAFNVPVVAIFGPTDWRTTAPFGTGHSLLRHPVDCAPCLLRECPIDHRCMTGVTAETVYNAAAQQLKRLSGLFGLSGSSGSQGNQTNVLSGFTVFLDRDGTLNKDTGYLKSPEEVELLPGVGSALARLKRAGARLVIVTNQSGVARGIFTLADLDGVHAKLQALLRAEGVAVDALYFCPHHPDDGCACRKPNTAMVERAVRELGLDLSRAYVVGDQQRDIELARRVRARSVLVTSGPTGREALSQLEREGISPDHVASSLAEAADWIFEDAKARYSLTVNR
ncbi:MAG: lipopolysaccharide heptosyltransferase II [Nitrospirota bacterium]